MNTQGIVVYNSLFKARYRAIVTNDSLENISKYNILYEFIIGNVVSNYYDFEMSKEKTVY